MRAHPERARPPAEAAALGFEVSEQPLPENADEALRGFARPATAPQLQGAASRQRGGAGTQTGGPLVMTMALPGLEQWLHKCMSLW